MATRRKPFQIALVLLGKGDVGIWIVLLSLYVLSGEIQ
jgi:hypothetical protein